MIVCLCRRVSDRDIRRNVEAGVRNFDLLQDETGVASACGCCLDCARDVFDTAMASSGNRSRNSSHNSVCHIDNALQPTAYPTMPLKRI